VNNSANTTDAHVDEITLLMYVERQLDRESAQRVSRHTQTCEKCLTLLRALDRESRLLTRSMLESDEPLPEKLAEFRERVRRSMHWIWGVVFGLALLGVYSLYTFIVDPWVQRFEEAGFGGTNLVSLVLFQGAFWKGWQSMYTLVEFVAMASFAGFAIFILRKYLKRGAAVAVVFATTMALLMVTGIPASAAEFQKGESVQVGKDQVVKGDLFAMGHQVKISGTVDGDLYALGEQVEIPGEVKGDVLCLCRSLRVEGHVDGNIRTASNNITLTGSVGRSVTSAAEITTIDSSGKIGHNLTSFSDNLTSDGALGGDLVGFFGDGSIDGPIGGELQAKGRSLIIGSDASIGGKAAFEGDKPPEIMSGAKLAFPLQYTKLEHTSHAERGAGYYIWRVIWAGAWILFGLVLILLMPSFARQTLESAERYGAAFGLGVLVFFGVAIAAVIACITIVGLLVGVSTLFLWIVSLFSSFIVVGAVVGRWILGRANELWPMIGRMALGVLIIVIVTGIPHIGGWIRFAVWIWGMGAIALAIYRKLQPVIAPNIPSMPSGPVGTPLPPNTTVSPA
jgi:cytoskeletal protein CcmA (bactofilin family)/anti-sigma factor RsiW